MVTKEKLLAENAELLRQCSTNTIASIVNLNKIFTELSTAKMEYLVELINLLFGQSSK